MGSINLESILVKMVVQQTQQTQQISTPADRNNPPIHNLKGYTFFERLNMELQKNNR